MSSHRPFDSTVPKYWPTPAGERQLMGYEDFDVATIDVTMESPERQGRTRKQLTFSQSGGLRKRRPRVHEMRLKEFNNSLAEVSETIDMGNEDFDAYPTSLGNYRNRQMWSPGRREDLESGLQFVDGYNEAGIVDASLPTYEDIMAVSTGKSRHIN